MNSIVRSFSDIYRDRRILIKVVIFGGKIQCSNDVQICKNCRSFANKKKHRGIHEILLPCPARRQASFLLWKCGGGSGLFPCRQFGTGMKKARSPIRFALLVAGFAADNYDFLVAGMFLALFFWRVTRHWRVRRTRPGPSCDPGRLKVVHFGGGSPPSSLPREKQLFQVRVCASAHNVLVGRICVKVNMPGYRTGESPRERAFSPGKELSPASYRLERFQNYGNDDDFPKASPHVHFPKQRWRLLAQRWGNASNRAEPSAIRWAGKLKLPTTRTQARVVLVSWQSKALLHVLVRVLISNCAVKAAEFAQALLLLVLLLRPVGAFELSSFRRPTTRSWYPCGTCYFIWKLGNAMSFLAMLTGRGETADLYHSLLS